MQIYLYLSKTIIVISIMCFNDSEATIVYSIHPDHSIFLVLNNAIEDENSRKLRLC